MKRTDAAGHDSNRYTEGNPALGVPATVVGAEEMNNIQEEICNVIEAAGITLDELDEDQLLEAINVLIGQGGSQSTQTVLDNQSLAVDITSLVFDKTEVKSVHMLIDVHRRDDGQNANELFKVSVMYDPEDDDWDITYDSQFEDSGVDFTVTSVGQVKYTSSNFGGANYDGDMRITQVTRVLI